MGLMDLVDRFAALLGISCIVFAIFTLYNIAVAKNSDTLFIAVIVAPLTVLSAIFLRLAMSIYSTYFPAIRSSQIFKISIPSEEKEE